jgi:hypothetical protein
MNAGLPAVDGRRVIRTLQRAGFVVDRIAGSHLQVLQPSVVAADEATADGCGPFDRSGGVRTRRMTPIPLNPETEIIARRLLWFEPPARALADPIRFLAYVMAYATPADLLVLRRYVSDDDFREALDNAPPGIIDPRSWAYCNLRTGRSPAPAKPNRSSMLSAHSTGR